MFDMCVIQIVFHDWNINPIAQPDIWFTIFTPALRKGGLPYVQQELCAAAAAAAAGFVEGQLQGKVDRNGWG